MFVLCKNCISIKMAVPIKTVRNEDLYGKSTSCICETEQTLFLSNKEKLNYFMYALCKHFILLKNPFT